jgi:non-heme chloroperoxidase
MSAPLPTRDIHVNGVAMFSIGIPEGDVVVYVHGSASDYRAWLPQLEELGRTYGSVSYSRRYHWPNDPPPDGATYRAAEHASDLVALLEQLDLSPVHVVCESFGGVVALAAAARRPELFRSLVLGEPPLFHWLANSPDGREMLKEFVTGAHRPAGKAFASGDVRKGMRLFLDGVLGPGTFDGLPPDVQDEILQNAPEMAAETATPLEDFYPDLSRNDVAKLRLPVLLVQGEHSPPIFAAVTDELARVLPHAERVTIPDASHTMNVENPAAYNVAVMEFLARH